MQIFYCAESGAACMSHCDVVMVVIVSVVIVVDMGPPTPQHWHTILDPDNYPWLFQCYLS